ncbi:MAG: TRAP transporter substrate-binding protein [Synergistaceae bacterium]|nr:TRAP transporter substrate-binding protein [Synergistaceae bacterium]
MKRKKLFVLVLSVFMVLTAFCWVFPGRGYAADTVVRIKLGTVGPEEGTDMASATRRFIDGVEADSGGKIKFDYYTNGSLGGDFDMAEMCALGTIQMCQPAFSVMGTYNPKFGVVDMPFLFDGPDNVIAALAGDFGDEIKKLYDGTGMMCLGLAYGGGRGMTNSKRPITEPADMKGLKMRVMESPTYIEMFKLFGSNPTPMSFSELFTALQNGTVDGQDNDPSLTFVAQFYEVQKYFSVTDHVYAINSMVISENFWNSLPDELKKIIEDNNQKYMIDYLNELGKASADDYIQKLAEKGMEITRLTDENRAKFREAVAPLYDSLKDKFGSLVEIARKYNS